MLKRAAEEVAVNLLFFLILLFVALLLTPSHTLALAWQNLSGEVMALGQWIGVLFSLIVHAVGALGEMLMAQVRLF